MLGVCKGVCTSSESYFFFIFFPSSFLSLFYPKKNTPPSTPPFQHHRYCLRCFFFFFFFFFLFSPFRWRRWVGTKRWEEVGSRRRVVGFKSCSKQSSRLSIVVRASVGRRIVAESNVCVCVSSVSRAFVSPSTSNWDLVVFFFLLCTLAVETRQKKN